MFLPSRARLTSRCPLTPHPRNIENPIVPTLLAGGSHHAFLVQCIEGGAVPAACGNKILTIFALYTFSHNQGQIRLSPRPPGAALARPVLLRYLTLLPRQAGSPVCANC